MRQLFTCFMLYAFLGISCSKPVDHISTSTLLPCHNGRNFDSATLASKLIGNWKFNRMECSGDYSAHNADRDSKVTFKENGTLVFTDNGTITNATWKLEVGYQDHKFSCVINPDLGHFRGRILLCEDHKVVFNNNIFLGCNLEYIKY